MAATGMAVAAVPATQMTAPTHKGTEPARPAWVTMDAARAHAYQARLGSLADICVRWFSSVRIAIAASLLPTQLKPLPGRSFDDRFCQNPPSARG